METRECEKCGTVEFLEDMVRGDNGEAYCMDCAFDLGLIV